MLEGYARAWAELDYDAIAHNVKEVQKLVGNTKILGIVKANAYGHGAVKCAKALRDCGVDFFGVAIVDEAIELREAGIEEPILILGYTPPQYFEYLDTYHLTQCIVSADYAKKMNAYAKEHNLVLHGHAKIDTGMSRVGIVYQDHEKHLDDIIEVYGLSHVSVDGIFSHFQ